MYKFFDYLLPDLPVKAIGELAGLYPAVYISQRNDTFQWGTRQRAWRSVP